MNRRGMIDWLLVFLIASILTGVGLIGYSIYESNRDYERRFAGEEVNLSSELGKPGQPVYVEPAEDQETSSTEGLDGPTVDIGIPSLEPGVNLTGEGVGIHMDMDGEIGIGVGF